MSFQIGDLVAEDYSPYWMFYNKSYTFMKNEADPSQGEAKKIIGVVTSVHKRYPDAFFEIPYFIYKIKWLNSPHGVLWDDKYFYEDELILISRVNPPPEHDELEDFDAEFEDEEEEE